MKSPRPASFCSRVKLQWSVDTVWISPLRRAVQRACWSRSFRMGGAQTYRAAMEYSGASYTLSSSTRYWGQVSTYTRWPRLRAASTSRRAASLVRWTMTTGISTAWAMRRSRDTASASRKSGRVRGWEPTPIWPAAFFSAITALMTPLFSQ